MRAAALEGRAPDGAGGLLCGRPRHDRGTVLLTGDPEIVNLAEKLPCDVRGRIVAAVLESGEAVVEGRRDGEPQPFGVIWGRCLGGLDNR